MKRLLILALLVALLPFQSVWAAAAPYCAHEPAASTAWHFGHHEHQHQGKAMPESDALGGYHVDCGTCQLGAVAPIASTPLPMATVPATARALDPPAGYRSHVPSVPEPRDRAAHAAAARFGGGVVPHSLTLA